MAPPDALLIRYEDFEDARFSHVGRYPAGQFLGYVTYASPKVYHPEETTVDGQIIWQEHTNCFAVLHRFDPQGGHIGTDVERVGGTTDSNEQDWARLDAMVAGLGAIALGAIRVRPFQVEIEGILHGLIYETETWDDGQSDEWVMLEPNDVMFHPPWDSGEYSS